MRVSIVDEPGLIDPQAKRYRVFLDGVERKCVFTADEEKRLVVVAKLNDKGLMQLNEDHTEVVKETLYGTVRIEPMD